MNAWISVLAASCVSDLSIGRSWHRWYKPVRQRAATSADSDNLESIMTPRSRANSPTLIVVDWSGMSVMLIWLSCWLDPSHRTSVFVGFSFSLLDDIQSLMALTHAVNLWTASAPILTMCHVSVCVVDSTWLGVRLRGQVLRAWAQCPAGRNNEVLLYCQSFYCIEWLA